jgi:maleate isomerase
MLTPSSNTVLEPVTYAMLRDLPDITAHFARFTVKEIALSATALSQFDQHPVLAAAAHLAHAKCDVIAWNGTSASWLGFEHDETLVRRIEEEAGVSAVTCVLGYRDLFRRLNATRIGLVTPYTSDVQAKIADTWGKNGFVCVGERHSGLSDNFSFCNVTEPQIEDMIRDVATKNCDAIAILCTNMRGASVSARLERELGIPLLDSVAVTLWASLHATSTPTSQLEKWGKLFTL